jgi:hypothetical protein
MADPLTMLLDPYGNLANFTDSQTIAMLGLSHDPDHQKIVSDLKAKQAQIQQPAATSTPRDIADVLLDSLDSDGCRRSPDNSGWLAGSDQELKHIFRVKFGVVF